MCLVNWYKPNADDSGNKITSFSHHFCSNSKYDILTPSKKISPPLACIYRPLYNIQTTILYTGHYIIYRSQVLFSNVLGHWMAKLCRCVVKQHSSIHSSIYIQATILYTDHYIIYRPLYYIQTTILYTCHYIIYRPLYYIQATISLRLPFWIVWQVNWQMWRVSLDECLIQMNKLKYHNCCIGVLGWCSG